MSKKIIEIPKYEEGKRCFYPVRADSYYKGCEHNCLYCFSRASQSRFKQWKIGDVENIDIEKLKSLFKKAYEENRNDKVSKIIRQKIPLRLGAITDLFQSCEKERRITLELIKILNEFDYPYIIITKSALISEEKYLNIIRKDLAYVQISITTLSEEHAKVLEPNASTIKERFECMKKLIDKGVYTAARVSPLIPIYQDGYFSKNKQDNLNVCEIFSFDLIKNICNIKPNNIIIEFLRVSPMTKKILKENNMNKLLDLYNNLSTKGLDGTLYFSLEEKEFYCEKISKICNERNVEFSICEDKDYEYFRKYWANKEDCCNALNKIFNINYKLFNENSL